MQTTNFFSFLLATSVATLMASAAASRAEDRKQEPGKPVAPIAEKTGTTPQPKSGVLLRAQEIDAYFDSRHRAKSGETAKLIAKLAESGIKEMADLEAALRKPRAQYPDVSSLAGKFTIHKVECEHVEYESAIVMYAPKDLHPKERLSLVIVGHGGNSSMDANRAMMTARSYLSAYAKSINSKLRAVVVAPVSTRGWGHIGNSLILSTISKLHRILAIDPDRIYVTGQSMGGHLSYRAALSLPDRWGAVSPHSGGYDFVEKGSIGNLLGVPGYAVWGVREPYGINKDNRTNAAWGKEHDLDWKFVERNGGHTIYQDELPKVATFFKEHPRKLYRDTVYLHQGGEMKFTKTWGVKGWPEHKVYSESRPLRWNIRHWIEVDPRPDLKEPLTVLARNRGNNQFEITANNVRKLNLYFHPKMADFSKPVTIKVNGKVTFTDKLSPDPKMMFDLAREFDDRGRIFWSRVPLEIGTDQVPVIENHGDTSTP